MRHLILSLNYRGIPQASCLEPILFNWYRSDFPNCVKYCFGHLYARMIANCILKPSVPREETMYSFLHVVPQHIWRTDTEVAVALEGGNPTVYDKVKVLGVMLDGDLTFSDHVITPRRGHLAGGRGCTGLEHCCRHLPYNLLCYRASGNFISEENIDIKTQHSAILCLFKFCLSDPVSPFWHVANMFKIEVVYMIYGLLVPQDLILK
ncbi:hypothetical protein J6590_099230 [Homalodisca vitripennis]|nr:hypothetical protein J6590_099230 [Homalodisca vitripennis]